MRKKLLICCAVLDRPGRDGLGTIAERRPISSLRPVVSITRALSDTALGPATFWT